VIAKLLEKDVERDGTLYAEQHGWWVAKFVTPGLKAVPDRIYVRTRRFSLWVVFIEWKKDDDEEPNEQQLFRHRELRQHGAEVYVFDKNTFQEFKRVME